MGGKQSKDETSSHTRRLDDFLRKDRLKHAHEIKLLLLGGGESGKSTIFKQMKIIHNHGYSPEERREFIPIIGRHVVENFSDLYRGATKLGLLSDEQQAEMQSILDEVEAGGLCESMVDIITIAWKSKPMQDAFMQRNKFHLADTTALYLNNLERLCDPGYIPPDEDILACRVRTIGVSEMAFQVNQTKFRMVDVGGQKNERRKWIHYFEDVHAVIFVVAISEYNQVMFEDDETNRLLDSLDLFQEIASNKSFTNTSMILFLNKKDLFEEKIKTTDLSVCFPEYTGGNNYDAAVSYVIHQFKSRCNQDVYTHVTCATNTDNMRFVFDSVKDAMVVRGAAFAGLL